MTAIKNDLDALTEEDVRTKIIFPWLLSQGFNLDQISLERSFSVRLGHTVLIVEDGTTKKKTSASKSKERQDKKKFTGRADIIVRNLQGRNLMVIEAKAPHIKISDDDRAQAISYARLLEGDIAPISVVMNGEITRVFDTFTGNELSETANEIQNRCENPKIIAEQKYGDLKAEALESLLLLSEQSLLSFCEGQVDYRMRPLYSEDLDSGKKFIPDLYVTRAKAQKHLDHLLDVDKRRVVVLIGAPQVGKTNFVCHVVRERIKLGCPSLFYPAIGLDSGLLSSILNDFQWISAKDINSPQGFLRKLKNILRRSNKRLVIFIDGWNEANLNLARQIDLESENLLNENIQIVITLTNIAAKRLLSGRAGNSSAIAEEASISSDGGQLLETARETDTIPDHWSVVRVGHYSKDECETAYDVYKQAYKVEVPPTHQKVFDPYMLGAAMKLYKGGTLPDCLDEPGLLKRLIEEKIRRAIDVEGLDSWSALTLLAKKMMTDGAPVAVHDINELWRVPLITKIPDGYLEAALLASVTNDLDQSAVNFYYDNERSYFIAYKVGAWLPKLAKGINLEGEFTLATKTAAGYEALIWFFRQPAHMATLIALPSGIPRFDNAVIRRVLISALCHLAPRFPDEHDAWLELARSYIDNDSDSLVIIECVKLVAILAEDSDGVSSVLGTGPELIDRIRAILSISEDYPLSSTGVGRVVLDAFDELHSEEHYGADTEIILSLKSLMLDRLETVQESAAVCLGYVDWRVYFEIVSEEIMATLHDWRRFEKFHLLAGVKDATDKMTSYYYGDICPGMLESVCEDEESRQGEYSELSLILTPVLTYLSSTDPSRRALEELLDTIRGEGNIASDPADPTDPTDPYTFPLPF